MICDDGAVLIDALWMYEHPTYGTRMSCGLYLAKSGGMVLRVWRNGTFYREWHGAPATLRTEANQTRGTLERDGWEAT